MILVEEVFLIAAKAENTYADFAVHTTPTGPECWSESVSGTTYIGSTRKILNYCVSSCFAFIPPSLPRLFNLKRAE